MKLIFDCIPHRYFLQQRANQLTFSFSILSDYFLFKNCENKSDLLLSRVSIYFHRFLYKSPSLLVHVAFTSGTCRLPCCQIKFVFAYFVLTYNCNLWDEANIFSLPFPDPVKEAISTSVFRVGLSLLMGCLSIYRQCGFHNLFSSEGNEQAYHRFSSPG